MYLPSFKAAFEIILRCNMKMEFRDSIEECEVYRPVLAAIKNHKKDPYFLGIAMETLASLAQSGTIQYNTALHWDSSQCPYYRGVLISERHPY